MRIDFPEEEHRELIGRFDRQGCAYTTRVSDEADRYKVGDILETPWKSRVRVSEIRAFDDINDHPFLDQLTQKQIGLISGYGRYVVLKLENVK